MNGIDLIFMPLYAPGVQPIELIWALSKCFVRKNWFKEQIIADCGALEKNESFPSAIYFEKYLTKKIYGFRLISFC